MRWKDCALFPQEKKNRRRSLKWIQQLDCAAENVDTLTTFPHCISVKCALDRLRSSMIMTVFGNTSHVR